MHLVAQNLTRVKALVIENTFLSLRNLIVSSDRIARLFFSPSIFDQWDTRAQLESIIRSESGLKPYILFIIGEKDTMINPSHTLELYDIALNSTHAALTKKIVFPSGGHHNDRQHNYHGQINTFLLETLT